MKKGMILGLLGMAFIAGLGLADDLVPVAVSPGAEKGPAVVRQTCPTFSWTAVSWAMTYKVVVFEAGDGETPAYEKIAANASPVLVKEIPGKAFSWTPSADETLLNGGSYVWYVGAMVNPSQGSWSEGRKFIIAEGLAWGVVSEPRENGIGASNSPQTPQDIDLELTAAAKENFSLANDPASQEVIDIQGTEGTYNTFYGNSAGNAAMTGTLNSFFGKSAGHLNNTGSSNTFLGMVAGGNNSSGDNNTFVGRSAGQNNTAASGNTFVGFAAGYTSTTGANNTFVGLYSGYSNTIGYNNIFLGNWAGFKNSAGYNNTFLGYYAGYKNTTASGNAFLGHYAGYNNTTGYYNTFVGPSAGKSNTTGYENTFVGLCAGRYNSTGYYNTYVGNEAGYYNTAGVGNVFLGYDAGLNEMGSHKLYISDGGDANPLIWGDFALSLLRFEGQVGIQTTPTTHRFEITGGAYCDGGAWVDGSSREYKENIEELTSGEAQQAFEKLEPVKYNYKKEKGETYLGFIAEDVPDLVAMNDRKGLNPMDMVAVLTKVVQEQQKALLEQQKSIATLQEKITKLEKRSRKEK
ncbi:MAG: tail fiber domain-containing protein [Candidatus Aminicenantales bacterium]